jgi:hypothetical protein
MNDPSTSSMYGPDSSLIQSNTRPIEDLAENTIRHAIFPSKPSTSADVTSEHTTVEFITPTQSIKPTISSTLPSEVTPGPSMKDAFSTSFIDTRAVGIQTWPIKGMEKWEGRILEIDGDIFTAELTPLDNDDRTTLVSEFRTKVLEAGDQDIQPGDLFYMTARPVRIRGLLTTSYSLQIRRPGNWTAKDLREILDRTRQRLEMLKDNVE